MLYLKKRLNVYYLKLSLSENTDVYSLYSGILRDYAKAHGFICEHNFNDKKLVLKACSLCGEPYDKSVNTPSSYPEKSDREACPECKVLFATHINYKGNPNKRNKYEVRKDNNNVSILLYTKNGYEHKRSCSYYHNKKYYQDLIKKNDKEIKKEFEG